MFENFNKESGPSPEKVNWEGWTPPWMSQEGQEGPQGWQGPRGPFGHRHGFGGPGGWRGPRGPFGHRHGFFGGPRGPFGPGFGPGRHWGIPDELLALRAEAAEVARLFAIAARGVFEHKERLPQLRAFLDRSRKELSDMIYGSSQGQATGGSESTGSSADVEQA